MEAATHDEMHPESGIIERFDRRYMQLLGKQDMRLDALEDNARTMQEQWVRTHMRQEDMIGDVCKIKEDTAETKTDISSTKDDIAEIKRLLAPNRMLDDAGRVKDFFLKNRMGQTMIVIGIFFSLLSAGKIGEAWNWLKISTGWHH